MPAHEHVTHGHLVRRKIFQGKNGYWYCRVFDRRTKRLHKVSTRTKVRRQAEAFIKDWIERKEKEETEGVIVPMRFQEAAVEYLRARQIRQSTRVEYTSCFKQFYPALGELFVHQIRVEQIESFIKDADSKELSGRTRQKYLRHLRSFFHWARLRSYTRRDPTRGLKVPKAARRAGRELTVEEARRLVWACRLPFKKQLENQKGKWVQEYEPPEYLFLAVLISLLTGLRRGNVLRLKWKHVDLKARKIRFPAEMMKANADLVIPIHKEVMFFLQEKKPGKADDLVIGANLRATTKAFKSATERAGLDHIRWHDLRHTFSTWVSEHASFVVQRRLMGHSEGPVTLDYTHVAFPRLLKAVDRLPTMVNCEYRVLDRVFPFCLDDKIAPIQRAIEEVRRRSDVEEEDTVEVGG